MKTWMFFGIAAGALLAASFQALAREETFELDNRFRARLQKEKIKQASLERRFGFADRGANDDDCGSQSIGNVDTGGRIGTGPREVFVFAPNAINLVGSRACR